MAGGLTVLTYKEPLSCHQLPTNGGGPPAKDRLFGSVLPITLMALVVIAVIQRWFKKVPGAPRRMGETTI